MHKRTRRDALKFAASLAVGSTAATAFSASADEPAKPATAPAKPADQLLAMAIAGPQGFMLSEPQTFRLEGDGASRDLIITSARDIDSNHVEIRIPSNCIRIFRADASVDEFTRQGGFHWRFFDKPGKTQLKTNPDSWLNGNSKILGPIVMIVRENQDSVRCYTMFPDLRC